MAQELLPILIADLVDDNAREYLVGVADAGGLTSLPLLAAPVDGSEHVLEVYTPGGNGPLVLLARAEGAPNAEGFPLRLRHPKKLKPDARQETAPEIASLAPKRATSHTLTARHTRDLSGPGGQAGHAAAAAELVGRSLAGGKFLIEAFVGSGGVGAVYRARHRELRMAVAVKVLHESFQGDVDFCARFHAEGLAASQLDHPNLTRVYDFGQEPDGLLYLAMELLQGTDLQTIMQREGRLSHKRILKLMTQVCAGLQHVHSRKIIHRDIKPENLVVLPIVDDDGEPSELVKVCDFGIALETDEKGQMAGTPAYMSPEQCRGEPLDAQSDVYACGVVLYELATGQVPFTGDVNHVLTRHQNVPPTPPSVLVPGLLPAFEEVILTALEKDPRARYAGVRELRRALRLALAPEMHFEDTQRNLRFEMPVQAPRPASTGEKTPDTPSTAATAAAAAAAARAAVAAGAATGEVTPRPPPIAAKPEWLQRGAYAAFGAAAPHDAANDLTSAFARDPAPFLRELAEEGDVQRFVQMIAQLDEVIGKLAEQRDSATLWKVASTLDVIATEGPQSTGSRAAIAASTLKVLADPRLLGPIAEEALTGAENVASTAARLLVRAGLGGAYAIYSARVKSPSAEARSRFKAIVNEIGLDALPVFRAALERLESRLTTPGAQELAEDLLETLPSVDDEVLGNIAARYARAPSPLLARAATAALPRLWGQRARALLVALLQYPNEPVAIAAISALDELRAIDEHVVRKLDVLLSRSTTTQALRAVAATALAHAQH